jgi:hypothetical protein
MNWLRLEKKNNRLKFKTLEQLPNILKESYKNAPLKPNERKPTKNITNM